MSLSTRSEVAQAVLAALPAFPFLKVCILYGSASRDQLGPHSDIDLAVGAGRPLSWDEHRQIQLELCEVTGREVDLIDLESLTGLLWELLWTEGVFLLKEHDPIVKYTGKAQSFVEDVKPAMMAMINHRLAKEFGPP